MSSSSELIERYLSDASVPKLEIGAGLNGRDGWLSTDLIERQDSAGRMLLSMDATRPFPFPTGSFDFIYSEHMIEHVSLGGGQAMLSECYRVLKPGGVLRIVTPSLGFLLRVISVDRSAFEEKYVEWSIRTNIRDAPGITNAIFFNNFMRDWGHTFIYDRQTLRMIFEKAGFEHIEESVVGSSRHPALSGMENTSRMPDGYLALESMVFEAAKRV